MAKIPKVERLLNLVAFLLRAHAPRPWADIRGKLAGYDDDADDAAIERRFERDKDDLRRMGVPIEYVQTDDFGNTGYFIRKEEYFLPPLDISADEAVALACLARLASAQVSGPMSQALQSAVQKLQFYCPVRQDILATPEERFLLVGPPSKPSAAPSPNLQMLSSAVFQRKTVTFRYYTISRNATEDRAVDPYGLAFWGGTWYLAGRAHPDPQVKVFKLDRIRGEVLLKHKGRVGPDFEMPADFRVADYVGVKSWQFDKRKPFEARVWFDATVAWMVQESLEAGQALKPQADGSAEGTFKVAAPDAFLRWVLSFGRHARIRAPKWLADRAVGSLQRVAKLYA